MSTNTPQIPDQSKQPESGLWTMRDVADFIKCSVRTVGNLQKAGMPFIKLGHLTRFEPKAVMRWMGLVQDK